MLTPAACGGRWVSAVLFLLALAPAACRDRSPASSSARSPVVVEPAVPPRSEPAKSPIVVEPAVPPRGELAELPVDRLLRRLAMPCPPPCSSERAGELFELSSLLTTRDRALATPERAQQTARIALRGLDEWTGWRRATALASISALAAMWPAAQSALYRAEASQKLRAVVADDVSDRRRGQALFALGALFPLHDRAGLAAAAVTANKTADRTLLRAGLIDTSRFVRRQAVLGATLARDEALDGPLLAALQSQLVEAPLPDALMRSWVDQADPALLRLPQRLTDEQASELLPLMPSFVELLLSLPPKVKTTAADKALLLTQLVATARPRSATALFLLAQVQSHRHDPDATATLRTALSLGNLPAVFLDALGPQGRALMTPPDVPAARQQVRQLLAARSRQQTDPPSRQADLAPPVTAPELGSQRLRVREIDEAALAARARAVLSAPSPDSAAARALGAELFASYPFGSAESYDPCLRSFLYGNNRDLVSALGLAAEGNPAGDRLLVGVVAAARPARDPRPGPQRTLKEAAGTDVHFGVTCALCHAQVDAQGRRQDGLPARTYDQGLLLAACVEQPIHYKAGNRNLADLLDYRPGRNDSSSDGVHNPTEIPSLFGLRVEGPVRWNADTPTLEVQIDRNLSPRSAPPEVIALVAAYLRELPLPPPHPPSPGTTALVAAGAQVFARTCQRCHAGSAYTTGEVIAQPELHTDVARISAVLPNSSEGYKVPSLLRISRSAPYLHDGSIPTLAALLDRERPSRLGRPATSGHRFGLDLPRRDRSALLAFLHTL